MKNRLAISGQVSFLAGICALSLGFGPAHAQQGDSELSITTRIQSEIVYVDGRAADARGVDGFQITDGWAGGNKNGANWGAIFVDGGHQISPTLRVFARVGLNIDMDGLKDGPARDREFYVGIESEFGDVLAGRLEAPYKLAGLGWDPLNASFLQARGNIGRSGGALGHAGYLDRSLAYRNSIGPVRIQAMASLDDTVANDGTGNDDHLVSGSLSVPMGPIELIGAYIDGSGYEGSPNDRKATKLGLHYNKDQWSAGMVYESRGTGLEDGDFVFATTSYRMDRWRLSANFGFFQDDKDLNDGTYVALGAGYQLHNLISIHGGIRQLDRDLTGKETIAGLGLRLMLKSGNLIN